MYEEFRRTNNPIKTFVLDFIRPDGSVSHTMGVNATSISEAVAYARHLARGTTLIVLQHI